MKLYKFIMWVCVGFLPLGVVADSHDIKASGNGVVSNVGAGAIEEKPSVTLDHRIAEADEMVSRSILAATDMRKQGQISNEEWPCVQDKLNKASRDIEIARDQYKAENHSVALFLTNMVEQNVSALNTDIQN